MTGHRLPHTKKGLCSHCWRRKRTPGQSKCTACHADYMRAWRARRKDELEELRAFRRDHGVGVAVGTFPPFHP